MAIFLISSGPWELSKRWTCDDCGASGSFTSEDDYVPRNHVATTGHSVVLTKTTEMTIYPMATEPPG